MICFCQARRPDRLHLLLWSCFIRYRNGGLLAGHSGQGCCCRACLCTFRQSLPETIVSLSWQAGFWPSYWFVSDCSRHFGSKVSWWTCDLLCSLSLIFDCRQHHLFPKIGPVPGHLMSRQRVFYRITCFKLAVARSKCSSSLKSCFSFAVPRLGLPPSARRPENYPRSFWKTATHHFLPIWTTLSK